MFQLHLLPRRCLEVDYSSIKYLKIRLTDNGERVFVGLVGLRVDLALVDALVLVGDRLDDEEPVVGVRLVHDPESVVGDVDEFADRNQAHVAVSNPRHLIKENKV